MFGITPPVIPGTTGSDTAGAFAVLAVLGNDSAYKARLDELVKLVKAAEAAADRAAADLKEAAAAQLTAENKLAGMAPREAAADAKLAQALSMSENNKAEIFRRETELHAALEKKAGELEAARIASDTAANKRAAELEDKAHDL